MTVADLKTLARHRRGPCVSLYQPWPRMARGKLTRHVTAAVSTAALRLLESLNTEGNRRAAPLVEAVDRLSQVALSDPHLGSFAIFCAPGLERLIRVPAAVTQGITVGSSFCVRPLLPYLRDGRRYHLLLLAAGVARLAVGGTGQFAMVELTAHDALVTPPSAHASHDLVETTQRVLTRSLKGDSAPLIVASEEPLQRLQSALRQCHVVEKAMRRELLSSAVNRLPALARRAAATALRERDARVLELLERARRAGRAIDDVPTIARAVSRRAVRSLGLARGARMPGTLDPTTGDVCDDVDPGHERETDLLSDLAAQVLIAGGTVFELDGSKLSTASGVLATLR